MTESQLATADTILENEIYKLAQANGLSSAVLEPITDGIYSAKDYLSSPLKLMWILKEPYDDKDANGNPTGGGWSIPKDLFGPNHKYFCDKTSRVVTYTTYCIIQNKRWNEVPYFEDDPSVADQLQNIAYINLSKMPASTKSSDSAISSNYQIWKDIIRKQIELYNPDILICGNTFKFIKDDFVGTNKVLYKNIDDMVGANVVNGKLWLDCYHPGQLSIKEGDYANSICDAVDWWKKL